MNHSGSTTTISRRRGLRRVCVLVGAICVMAATAAAADPRPQLRTVEECLESGTRLVSLPAEPSGTLSASQCSGCESLRLRFEARTRYFIGKEAVPYARFREAAGKGDVRLYVFYRPNDRTLTRLRLAAIAAKTP